jgi:glutamate/tyrosine decarboxylase-like PLP-dependent enzyme
MSESDLYPMFLGPYAENADLLEETLVDFLRDHMYWRRNFHPEDPPAIPTSASHRDDYIDFVADMKQELHALSADLKKSVPFFSPRYVGHMASDLLLPGLIANLVTTLYNPNNVAEEAAPATLEKEIDVGFQLADMFGFPTDPTREPCGWGHLTSGGSVANYEGLRNIISLRYFPLALADAVERTDLHIGAAGPLERAVRDHQSWELFHLSLSEIIELRDDVADRARDRFDRDDFRRFNRALSESRLESRGLVGMHRAHPDLKPPAVVVPRTAHYSWAKAMKILGLGTENLVDIEVDGNMRMDIDDLEATLESLRDERVPVLSVVGVLGNTEFGTVDPIGDLVDLRDAFEAAGTPFPIHIDAAWGGYLASVFRSEDGGMVSRKRLQKDFHYFPSRTVYRAFDALSEVDSITVDPHKLGYVPYPAGAYVSRHGGMLDFIAQGAAYVFDVEDDTPSDTNLRDKLRNLGQYILEGSKPGSAAAAVHVTHNVLPLHTDGFGRVLKGTIRASEYFFDQIDEFRQRLDGVVDVQIPFEPDSNLVCLAINPEGNESLERMNRFGRRLFDTMRVDASQPIQRRPYIASYTSLMAEDISPERARRVLEPLGISTDMLTEDPAPDSPQSDHVYLIRNTLMNPWLLTEDDGRNYIDRYLDYLADAIRDCRAGAAD